MIIFGNTRNTHTHQKVFCLLATVLQTVLVEEPKVATPVDLFMSRGSILALRLSLRLASYTLFLLTEFVIFINIRYRHSWQIRVPRGEEQSKVSHFSAQTFAALSSRLWQRDSDCFLVDRWQFSRSSAAIWKNPSLRGHTVQYVQHRLDFLFYGGVSRVRS